LRAEPGSKELAREMQSALPGPTAARRLRKDRLFKNHLASITATLSILLGAACGGGAEHAPSAGSARSHEPAGAGVCTQATVSYVCEDNDNCTFDSCVDARCEHSPAARCARTGTFASN
jgi:hypothetical protein